MRSYLEVYPRGWAMLATNSLETPVLGLVARRDGERLRPEDVRQRLASAKFPRPLEQFGLSDDLALLGSFIAGPESLAEFAGDAPLNTDDHPVVTYLAPRITYAPDSLPRDRLLELLDQVRNEPDNLLVTGDTEWQRRLVAYWQARDRLSGARPRRAAHARMFARCWRRCAIRCCPCCTSARTFARPTIHCYAWPTDSRLHDSGAARELLTQLVREQPARPEAAEALRALATLP